MSSVRGKEGLKNEGIREFSFFSVCVCEWERSEGSIGTLISVRNMCSCMSVMVENAAHVE